MVNLYLAYFLIANLVKQRKDKYDVENRPPPEVREAEEMRNQHVNTYDEWAYIEIFPRNSNKDKGGKRNKTSKNRKHKMKKI